MTFAELRVLSFAACLQALSILAAGQALGAPQVAEEQLLDVSEPEQSEDIGFSNGSFVAVPIPFSNPAIGTGLTFGAGYLFRTAPESDKSYLGGAYIRSDNGSEGYGVGGSLDFVGDLNFSFVLASLGLNYDLTIRGVPIPIEQDGDLFSGTLGYDVTETNTFGLNYRFLRSDIGLASISGEPPPELLPDTDLNLGSSILSWTTIAALDQSAFDTIAFELKGGAGIDEIRFGSSYADVTPVPEPGAAMMMGLAAGMFLLRRRRSA